MSGPAPCVFLTCPSKIKPGDPLHDIVTCGNWLKPFFVEALCKHARIRSFRGVDYGHVPSTHSFGQLIGSWVDLCSARHGTTPTLAALHGAAHVALADVEIMFRGREKDLAQNFIRLVAAAGGIPCAVCAPPASAKWSPAEIASMYGTAATAFLHTLAATPPDARPAAIAEFIAKTPVPK